MQNQIRTNLMQVLKSKQGDKFKKKRIEEYKLRAIKAILIKVFSILKECFHQTKKQLLVKIRINQIPQVKIRTKTRRTTTKTNKNRQA